jgi:hypothetical protein
MKWIGLLLGVAIFSGVTGGAWLASSQAVGLPGMLDKPVSVRQQSVSSDHRHRGPIFLYFGSHRRHYGGGFRGGK